MHKTHLRLAVGPWFFFIKKNNFKLNENAEGKHSDHCNERKGCKKLCPYLGDKWAYCRNWCVVYLFPGRSGEKKRLG